MLDHSSGHWSLRETPRRVTPSHGVCSCHFPRCVVPLHGTVTLSTPTSIVRVPIPPSCQAYKLCSSERGEMGSTCNFHMLFSMMNKVVNIFSHCAVYLEFIYSDLCHLILKVCHSAYQSFMLLLPNLSSKQESVSHFQVIVTPAFSGICTFLFLPPDPVEMC